MISTSSPAFRHPEEGVEDNTIVALDVAVLTVDV
jgi:hypothetical protein